MSFGGAGRDRETWASSLTVFRASPSLCVWQAGWERSPVQAEIKTADSHPAEFPLPQTQSPAGWRQCLLGIFSDSSTPAAALGLPRAGEGGRTGLPWWLQLSPGIGAWACGRSPRMACELIVVDFFEILSLGIAAGSSTEWGTDASSGWPPRLTFCVWESQSQPLCVDVTWLLAGNSLGLIYVWASLSWQSPWGLPTESTRIHHAVG